jgi:hypothetical protein
MQGGASTAGRNVQSEGLPSAGAAKAEVEAPAPNARVSAARLCTRSAYR